MDGDTVKMLTEEQEQIKIRLANIDCPENKQAYSQRAKQFTAQAVYNKKVLVKVQSKDRYGRFIGNVIYDGRKNLSEELVKHGWAWHYLQYSKDPHLGLLEKKARRKKLGLWKDPYPMPPWEWRKLQKKKRSERKKKSIVK